MTSRIAIVGAGAVGSYVGAHMIQAGEDVVLIDQYPAHIDAMRRQGLHISGLAPRDNFSTPVNALHICDVQRLAKQKPVDIALIAVKAYDTSWAAALIAPYMAASGIAVSMQNGINDDQVAAIVGRERTLGVTIAGCGVDLKTPGHVKRANVSAEGHMVFRTGEMDGQTTDRVKELVRVLSKADAAAITNNLAAERWSKLVVNAMRPGLASLTKINIPDQDRNDVTRGLMVKLAAEAVRVGQALGYPMVKIQGIEPETMLLADSGDATALEKVKAVLFDFASRYDDNTMPSMAQDIVKGRRTEVDGLNGLIVEKGRQAGVSTPINAEILARVRRLERGEIEAGLHTVSDLI